MNSKILCIAFILTITSGWAQDVQKKILPRTMLSIQYAGSTGLGTVGYFKAGKKEKLELGLLYGFTPAFVGGPLHSLSLKLIYNPFRIKIREFLISEPIQGGVFISQNFGSALETKWGSQYPDKYYWWHPSQRYHLFFSTSLAYYTSSLKKIDHVSFYFETNTNDLYIASYFPKNNHRSLTVYDIVFLGSGLKFYLR